MKHTTEKGQTIILIAVALLGLVTMAALIVDGGYMYLNRRTAQTAADSGALAGAFERCANHGSTAEIEAAITEYVQVENNAVLENWFINADNDVEVLVSLTRSTFFARVFGSTMGTVQASAAAGCFSPRTAQGDVMPIAFSCKPPVGGSGSGEDCVLQKIPFEVFDEIRVSFDFENYLLDEGDNATAASYQNDLLDTMGEGKMIYVVMDSEDFSYDECIEEGLGGSITCDFNGDGIYDIGTNADRGWLQLEGGNGADEINDIMERGTLNPIDINTWYFGEPGVQTSTYFVTIDYRLGEYALVPVFDAYCSQINADNAAEFAALCPEYDSGDGIQSFFNGDRDYYRVVAFAPFYVTCVSSGKSSSCPGKDFAGLKHNVGTIEGYFIDGYTVGGKVEAEYEVGAFVITLTQ
ncbi:MAG: Tad domain-containing protein [Anaerolineales bacterium]|nr:Tad domain-containing protein [Anaerolineales bacterium]